MEKFIGNLPIEVTDIRASRGGDVNDAYKIYSADKLYYMLVQKNCYDSFYDGEIAGLKLFEEIGINAPRVIDHGFVDGDAYLLLSFLEEASKGSQSELAEVVAKMHQKKSPNGKFGFDYPYRGSQTTFSNDWKDTWAEVFLEERMNVLAKQLMDMDLWTDYDYEKFEKVYLIMDNELKNQKSQASLLHGDLWGGNYMFLSDGSPALFDPSPFYGDREFDIGITTVFGEFTDEFYQRYNEIYPLEDGYRLRLEFYRLYLYMVHLVKFGEMYESSVNAIMENILNF
ncbi:fructosamine kinase family protein [Anaerococcus sp. Marseille-Q5996]|uniref:fructosamine kinase family protein n=1 Tax=Anaerococcus sp. Marseille-Q5996 TaxID=2972769 RepID=UPI0021C575A7|nr:fructosamine kinase family protein [Anaerococcus sp. Marseille-Q5996]